MADRHISEEFLEHFCDREESERQLEAAAAVIAQRIADYVDEQIVNEYLSRG